MKVLFVTVGALLASATLANAQGRPRHGQQLQTNPDFQADRVVPETGAGGKHPHRASEGKTSQAGGAPRRHTHPAGTGNEAGSNGAPGAASGAMPGSTGVGGAGSSGGGR